MQRFLPLTTALFIVSLSGMHAQQGVREVPPLYRGPVTDVRGVYVTPIAGVPFSATVEIESKQPLPDGTVVTRHTQALIARDSRGRIRNERHMLVPESFKGEPPLLSVHIFDPATRLNYFFGPDTHIARQRLASPAPAVMPNPPGSEDLGYTTLNDMQAKGTRVTRTVPAQASGTGKPVTIVDEFWYSEDLHMNLLERHTDIRGGTQTVAILSISREEPSPELFEVPPGYKIVDMTPPVGVVHGGMGNGDPGR